jgi:hypothetical protein
MRRSFRLVAVMAGTLALAAACGPTLSKPASSAPAIRLTSPQGGHAYVEVTGLSSDALDALRRSDRTADEWSAILRVAVSDEAPGMLGSYSVAGGALRFTPQFPLDPGREYRVRFDPARIPGAAP